MRSILSALSLFAAVIAPAKASEITYGVNFQGSAFSIVGTITTDGTTGPGGTIAPLSDSDVTAYNLKVSIPSTGAVLPVACFTNCYAAPWPYTEAVPGGPPIGTDGNATGPALFATQQYLLFNFVTANSNVIIFGQNTYPSDYVEFYDHLLIPDDEGAGAVQVGGGAWYPAVQTDFSLGNLQEYSSDGTYIIGTATPLPATLPLFATGIGAMGLIGWRRKRKAQAAA
jgi:hypothetical protein